MSEAEEANKNSAAEDDCLRMTPAGEKCVGRPRKSSKRSFGKRKRRKWRNCTNDSPNKREQFEEFFGDTNDEPVPEQKNVTLNDDANTTVETKEEPDEASFQMTRRQMPSSTAVVKKVIGCTPKNEILEDGDSAIQKMNRYKVNSENIEDSEDNRRRSSRQRTRVSYAEMEDGHVCFVQDDGELLAATVSVEKSESESGTRKSDRRKSAPAVRFQDIVFRTPRSNIKREKMLSHNIECVDEGEPEASSVIGAGKNWCLVCATYDGWQALTDQFKNSLKKCEKDLAKSLTINFLPTIKALLEEKVMAIILL